MILVQPVRQIREHCRQLVPGDFRALTRQLDNGETLVAIFRNGHRGMCAIALPHRELYDELAEIMKASLGFYAVPLALGPVSVRRPTW